jgi:hypothetical protein
MARPRGRPFEKGNRANPGGRPGGNRGISQYIKSKTAKGKELVNKMLEIAANDKKTSNRIEAIKWLADRGLGKAPDYLEVTNPPGRQATKLHDLPWGKAQ